MPSGVIRSVRSVSTVTPLDLDNSLLASRFHSSTVGGSTVEKARQPTDLHCLDEMSRSKRARAAIRGYILLFVILCIVEHLLFWCVSS